MRKPKNNKPIQENFKLSATTVTYQCPNCGAGLLFDPEKQVFKCEFCLSEFTENELEQTDAHQNAVNAQAQAEEFCGHMNAYMCPSCGAEIIADENTAADFCYYCHNPIVLSGRLTGEIQPTKIIPFKYDKDAAKEKFLAFAKKKWFVPRDFTYPEQIDKISGVYFPFWVTDVDTDSQINARGIKVRTWVSGNYNYTEESIFSVFRRGNIHFEDIVNSALTDVDKKMVEGVLPYPPEAQQDFSMTYLTGFTAKKRNIERESLTDSVRERINKYSETLLKSTAPGYTSLNITDRNVQVKKSHWDYSLMPIWILTYKNKKGKVYTYAMNGHTGKIYGELPISKWKLALGAIIASLLLAPIIALIIAGVAIL